MPCDRARFFSATLRLESICCRAEVVSAGVNCGAITGGSGLLAAVLSAGAGVTTWGRAGTARDGQRRRWWRQFQSQFRHGIDALVRWNLGWRHRETTVGRLGRNMPAPRQVLVLFLRGLQPAAHCTAHKHNTIDNHARWRVLDGKELGFARHLFRLQGVTRYGKSCRDLPPK